MKKYLTQEKKIYLTEWKIHEKYLTWRVKIVKNIWFDASEKDSWSNIWREGKKIIWRGKNPEKYLTEWKIHENIWHKDEKSWKYLTWVRKIHEQNIWREKIHTDLKTMDVITLQFQERGEFKIEYF